MKIFLVFANIGISAFGASAGEVLRTQLVERHKWLSNEQFKDSLVVAGLLPGPFHVNLVIANAFQINGIRAAFIALTAYLLPGFVLAAIIAYGLNQDYAKSILEKHPGILQGMLAAIAGQILIAVRELGFRATKGRYEAFLLLAIGLLLIYCGLHYFVVVVSSGFLFLITRMARRI